MSHVTCQMSGYGGQRGTNTTSHDKIPPVPADLHFHPPALKADVLFQSPEWGKSCDFLYLEMMETIFRFHHPPINHD